MFHGKKETGEWVEGDLLHKYNGSPCIVYWENGNSYVVDVLPESVGEYTWIKDNNGRKVFEGEFIRVIGRGRDKFGEIHDETGIVEFRNGCFYVRFDEHDKDDSLEYIMLVYNFEVTDFDMI